jgi:uncharacterized protein YciI
MAAMKILAALVALAMLPMAEPGAQEGQASGQYVYILRLAPQFHAEAAWTDTENAVVARHFAWLTDAVTSGQVILVGRTTESLDKTFGIVIFEAGSADAASEFMRSDPAVVAGLMTATVHPYSVALQRK